MGETGEREGRVGVICESDLRRLVFVDIACSNAVGKLAFVALNMWMIVNWQGMENFNSHGKENSLEKSREKMTYFPLFLNVFYTQPCVYIYCRKAMY